MGVKFSEKACNKGSLDLTQCFRDNFKEVHQRYILSFATQADIEVYPPAIIQLAIDYLRSIAEGVPEKVLVTSTHDILVVNN